MDNIIPNDASLFELLAGSLTLKGYEVYWNYMDETMKKVDKGEVKQHRRNQGSTSMSSLGQGDRNGIGEQNQNRQRRHPQLDLNQSANLRPNQNQNMSVHQWKPKRFRRRNRHQVETTHYPSRMEQNFITNIQKIIISNSNC